MSFASVPVTDSRRSTQTRSWCITTNMIEELLHLSVMDRSTTRFAPRCLPLPRGERRWD